MSEETCKANPKILRQRDVWVMAREPAIIKHHMGIFLFLSAVWLMGKNQLGVIWAVLAFAASVLLYDGGAKARSVIRNMSVEERLELNSYSSDLQLASDTKDEPNIKLSPVQLAELRYKLPAWARDPNVEKTAWLNNLICKLWPNMKQAVEQSIRESVVWEDLKPKFLGVLRWDKIDLGSDFRPLLEGITFFKTSEDQVSLEIKLVMATNCNIQVVAGVSEKLPLLPIHINSLFVKGTMRIVLAPLVKRWPCFSSMSMTFTHPPTIDLGVRIGNIQLTSIPGVPHCLRRVLRDSLAGFLIWPGKLDIPILEAEAQDTDEAVGQRPLGLLVVNVLKARNLKKADWNGKSDPYVVVTADGGELELCHVENRSKNTKVIEKTLNPNWDVEHFEWLVFGDVDTGQVEFRVMDWDRVGRHEHLGSHTLPLSTLTQRAFELALTGKQGGGLTPITMSLVMDGHMRGSLSMDYEFCLPVPSFTQLELAKEVEDHKAEENRLAEDGKRQVVPASTGLLLVTLHSCRNLMTKPKQGSLALHHLADWTTDAYIKARLGQQKVRSKTHKNTSNPVFDEGFKLLVQNLELQTLRLKVMDDDYGKDRHIGTVSIPLNDLRHINKTRRTYTIQGQKDADILVSLEYLHLTSRPHNFSFFAKKMLEENQAQGAEMKLQEPQPNSPSSDPSRRHSLHSPALSPTHAPQSPDLPTLGKPRSRASTVPSSLAVPSPASSKSLATPSQEGQRLPNLGNVSPSFADSFAKAFSTPKLHSPSSAGSTGLSGNFSPPPTPSNVKTAKVQVVVHTAKGLKPPPGKKTCNPYVSAHVGTNKKRSRRKNKTLRPEWEETLWLRVSDPQKDVLQLSVKDWHLLSSNVLLGSFSYPISALLPSDPENLYSIPAGGYVLRKDFELIGSGVLRVSLTLILEK